MAQKNFSMGKTVKSISVKYQEWGKGAYSDLSNLMVNIWLREQKDVKGKQMGKEDVKPHLKITWCYIKKKQTNQWLRKTLGTYKHSWQRDRIKKIQDIKTSSPPMCNKFAMCTGWFSLSLTDTRITWERGSSTGKMSLP